MKYRLNFRQFCLSYVINFLLIILSLSEVHAANILSPGGLSNRPDAVVITGHQMDDLLGIALESIGVYAANLKGEIGLIPFQVDERFPKGAYVLIENQLPGTGKLSHQDELVFMAKDAGSRISPEDFPFTNRMIQEVELKSSDTPERAWAYIVSSPIPSIHTSPRYVQFGSAENVVMGKNYFFSYAQSMESQEKYFWQPHYQSLSWINDRKKDKRSFLHQDFSLTANLLEKATFSVQMATLGGLVEWNMEPTQLMPRYVGQINGPVRVVRKIRLHPKVLPGINIKPVTIIQRYYDQFMSTSMSGEISKPLLSAFSKLKVTYAEDFSSISNLPVTVHPYLDKTDSILLTANAENGIQAATIWRLNAEKPIHEAFNFLSEADAENPCSECFQFELDAKKLPSGAYTFELMRFFPQSLHKNHVASFFQMNDAPLQVRVSTVKQNLVFRLPK